MYVYNEQAIRHLDQEAIDQGYSLFTLMENAGRELFSKIKFLLTKEKRITILAGKGNNGGDGIVLARYLKHHDFLVNLVFPLGEPKTEVAKEHLSYYQKQNFTVSKWNKQETFDVIIDCILGIGTRLPLNKNILDIISWSNQMKAVRIAIDLPTGTLADKGQTDIAFKADHTFALHGIKPAAFLLPSSEYFGEIHAVDIGLKQASKVKMINKSEVADSFPRRGATAHKGTFGTSLLVAGSDEMPGSALLAAIGAIRSGTGKLMIATSALAAQIIATSVPEATYIFGGLKKIAEGRIDEKIAAAGIGPGISDHETVIKALNELAKQNIPIVIDAGALDPTINFQHLQSKSKAPFIITPHPGEFSRLTQIGVEEIQANRLELAQRFAAKNNITVVLKGHYTIIAYPDGETFINPTGNSGLAKGGSGDVLTGMMVSMLATHSDYRAAVRNAVYIHGLCADLWKEKYSETTMVASDFDELLPQGLKQIEYE